MAKGHTIYTTNPLGLVPQTQLTLHEMSISQFLSVQGLNIPLCSEKNYRSSGLLKDFFNKKIRQAAIAHYFIATL